MKIGCLLLVLLLLGGVSVDGRGLYKIGATAPATARFSVEATAYGSTVRTCCASTCRNSSVVSAQGVITGLHDRYVEPRSLDSEIAFRIAASIRAEAWALNSPLGLFANV